MPFVWVTWAGEDSRLIGRNECLVSPDMLERAGEVARVLAHIPENTSVALQCELEAGDEGLLADLIDESLAVLQERPLPIRLWEISTSMPRYGVTRTDFARLFSRLPPCPAIRLAGFVKEALCALPPDLYGALETLELRECGAAFSGVCALCGAMSLKSITISGANNVKPPWSPAGFEGFLSLKHIRLDGIASLQTYGAWIDPMQSSISRQLPIVEIGAVNIPHGPTMREIGDHVRFGKGSEHARQHWFQIAPSYFECRDAQTRGVTQFEMPARCHMQMLGEMLGTSSKIRKLDCRAIESLRFESPHVWTSEKLGLDTESPEIRIELPALDALCNRRDPQGAEKACDNFIESLERMMMQPGESRRLHVVMGGHASPRLQAWKWLLDESGSRLKLHLTDTAEPLPASVGREVSLELSNSSHKTLCQLLAKRGVRTQFLDRLRVIGSLDPAGHKLLEQAFDAIPGLNLDIAAHCTGGAEWLIGSFLVGARSAGRQVTLSKEVEERIASLDFERRAYDEAAAWALQEAVP
jgi:hypothetical protein